MTAVQNSVKSFLKTKHIEVPNDWMTACIDWVVTDTPGLSASNVHEVSKKVYEQWLYCDLTEIGTCCLPVGLGQQRVTTISGYFAVQVNQVRDVGHQAYSQYQKIQKADTENSVVSAEQQHQQSWEPKPSRMLMLQITDGTRQMRGMEYRTIPALTPNIKPGTKLLISGNITSRRGTLLLTRELVQVLGGEVESMLVPNALQNVLARCLGLEETDTPRVYEETPVPQVPPSQVSQYYPSQLHRPTPTPTQGRGRGRGQGVAGRPAIGANQNRTATPIESTLSFDDDMGDEDFLDPNMEAVLSQIENDASPNSSHSNTSQGLGQSRASGVGGMNSCVGNNTQSGFSVGGMISCLNNGGLSRNGSGQRVEELDNEFDNDDEIFSNFDLEDSISSLPENTTAPNQQTAGNTIGNSSRPTATVSSFRQNNNTTTRPPQAPFRQSSQPFNLSTSSKSSKPKDSSSNGTSRLKQTTLHAVIKPRPQGLSGREPIQKSNIAQMGGGNSGQCSFDMGMDLDMEDEQPATSSSRNNSDVLERVQQEPPFTYLCFLPDKPTHSQDVVVKGFILTLCSRLEQKDGQWCVRVLINDGTASKEVDIDSQMLEQLIGLSVQDLERKRAEARSNPALKAHFAKSVMQCQQQLISLCCLLHLHLAPSFPRPMLTSTTPLTPLVSDQLHTRAQHLLNTNS